MATTSSSALPYPVGTDAPNVALYFANLAAGLDRKVVPAFTTVTARNTAIPAPTQGQQCTVAGVEHTYDGSAWRWQRTGLKNGTTDAGGNLVVAHGLGAVPTGVILTPSPQANNTLDRTLTLNYTGRDATNFTIYAKGNPMGTALASTQIEFAWIAFV